MERLTTYAQMVRTDVIDILRLYLILELQQPPYVSESRETRTKNTCACVQMSKIGALELYVTGSIADDQLRGSLQAKSGGDVKYLPKFDVGHIGLSSPAINPSWFQGLLRACSRKSMTHSFSALERNIPTAKNIAFAIHHLHFAQICYK